MFFVKTEDLKVGMRLARPIFSHNGVLLFEQGSKITPASLTSISNFGLIGIYILDPAEPAPPMGKEDMEFERFQAAYVYQIQKELQTIVSTRKPSHLIGIIGAISKAYGHLDKKINFIQTPRTKEDYLYKHILNVTILCAMMAHQMNLRIDEVEDLLTAALLHDIGQLMMPKNRSKELQEMDQNEDDEHLMQMASESRGFELIDDIYGGRPNVKRICSQAARLREDLRNGNPPSVGKAVDGSLILFMANYYDKVTAVDVQADEAPSEVATVMEMTKKPEFFVPGTLRCLTDSIKIVSPGVSVELNSGEKAMVISENDRNILRPRLLMYRDNSIIDLEDAENLDLEIADIMKSLDNRYVMDVKTLEQVKV